MKKIFLFLSFVVLIVSSSDVYAQSRSRRTPKRSRALAQVCPRVVEVGSASSTIYKQSAPLRSGGIGTSIVGYREEPTLIMSSNISSRGVRPIYDSKGGRIASCPWADAHGHSGGRLRCTVKTSTVRRSAVQNTRSQTIYFGVTDKLCVRVADAGKCYGSSKGLCDRVIQ
jgi:hypothetical protein